MLGVLKATIEHKVTSVTTYFKKLTQETTYLLSQLLSKVTVVTYFRYGEIFSDGIIINFLLILTVK